MRERAEATEPRVCPQCKMKLWPRAKSRPLRFHELRHTFGSLLIMSGANLVCVQKLLGHSNPKITAEKTYAHFAPDYLLAEVNLLRFGVDYLAPIAKSSQRLAAVSTIRVTPELQSASDPEGEAGTPSLLPEGISASEMAGCTGLEFSRGDLANRATTHANSSIRSKTQQVGRTTDIRTVPRETSQFRRSLGDILETNLHTRQAVHATT